MTVNPPVSPDAELLQRHAAGQIADEELLSTLFDRYYPVLQAAAQKMRLSRSDADEVIQITFLRAYQHLRDYRAVRSFPAWLLSVFRNAVHEHIREARRRVALSSDITDTLQSDEPSAYDVALSHEQMNNLRRAIDRLHPKDTQILLLKFVEGLSLEEIATRMGTSPIYARVSVHRAVEQLRRRLDVQQAQPAESEDR